MMMLYVRLVEVLRLSVRIHGRCFTIFYFYFQIKKPPKNGQSDATSVFLRGGGRSDNIGPCDDDHQLHDDGCLQNLGISLPRWFVSAVGQVL